MIRTHVPVGWIIAAALFPATVFAQTAKPSFGKDIAPILYAKCAMCHRAGEVAPMSLMSYDEVRPWARAIKNKDRRPPDAAVVRRGRGWQMAQRSPPESGGDRQDRGVGGRRRAARQRQRDARAASACTGLESAQTGRRPI